nr:alkyl sulfatase C-terminal domain-containing protein [Paraburkholderia phenazinium]
MTGRTGRSSDAYEQTGYQAESASWRNFYLIGAMELRNGVRKMRFGSSQSPDTIKAMPLEMFLDYQGVRLNGACAAGKSISFNFVMTDTNESYVVGVENSALHYSKGKTSDKADASVTTTRTDLNEVMMGNTSMEKLVMAGKAKISGMWCLLHQKQRCRPL